MKHYRGWKIWTDPRGPATGQWRAERFGVDLSANTLALLRRIIDRRCSEYPEEARHA